MLRQYFNCNERLEIFLTCFCNMLCYVGHVGPFIFIFSPLYYLYVKSCQLAYVTCRRNYILFLLGTRTNNNSLYILSYLLPVILLLQGGYNLFLASNI